MNNLYDYIDNSIIEKYIKEWLLDYDIHEKMNEVVADAVDSYDTEDAVTDAVNEYFDEIKDNVKECIEEKIPDLVRKILDERL